MKAAVCRAFGEPLVIEELVIAEPGPGEVRVRMAATAICHSDITYADGGWGGTLPAVYGHEGAGVVDAVGSDVPALGAGDHVVVTLIRSCGRCHGCVRGMPVMCDATFPLDAVSPLRTMSGEPVAQMMRTAAFAEYVLVHHSQLVKVDATLPLDVASLFACGVITGVGAVTNTAQVPPGSHVVVIGAGGVGLNAVQGARLAGAQTVIAIDISPAKFVAAIDFGATHVLNPATTDVAGAVKQLTEGRGADFVFVTVGAKSVYDQSYELLALGAAVVLVGMPPTGVSSEIDPSTLAAYSQRILGSKMGGSRIAVDIPNLFSLYRQGRLKVDELISGRYPLHAINDAIAAVKYGDAIRNVIVFG